MKPRFSTLAGPAFGLLILAATVPWTGGCDGFDLNWTAIEDTISLYSLARPEYIDQPSAFDFYNRITVVVEQPTPGAASSFDLAFSEVDGAFVMLPAGLFATFDINPGVMPITTGETFEELAVAPRDGYITDEPVTLDEGGIYVVRTRRSRGGCNRYAKFEVLDLDPQGLVEFRQVRNSLCNDRELIPAED
ncbi:MAG: hypothetical protein ACOCUW_03385 [Gemmatimonadota bacterium]